MGRLIAIDGASNSLNLDGSTPATPNKKTIRERVNEIYNEIVPENVRKKLTTAKEICIKVWPAIKSTAVFIKELIPQLDNIIAVFANAAEALKPFFKIVKDVSKGLSEFKIVVIASIPGTVYDFAMSIYKFVRGIQKKLHAIVIADRTLGMIDGAIDITKIVAVFVGNTTFGVVAGFLSAINVVIQGKNLYHSAKFYDVHIKKMKDDANPLANIEKRDIKDRLDPSSASDVFDKVGRIWAEATQEAKKEVVTAFKRRSIQKIASHILKLVSATITIVATAVLLCFPPLLPVAFGLYALSALISLAEFIADKAVSNHWEKVMNKHDPIKSSSK